jgi:hypothetical protein
MAERGATPPTSPRPAVDTGPVLSTDPVLSTGSTAQPDPDVTPDLFDPRIAHDVRLIERGPFTVAVCGGCGWESFARRSRPLARREGRDHEVLFDAI